MTAPRPSAPLAAVHDWLVQTGTRVAPADVRAALSAVDAAAVRIAALEALLREAQDALGATMWGPSPLPYAVVALRDRIAAVLDAPSTERS